MERERGEEALIARQRRHNDTRPLPTEHFSRAISMSPTRHRDSQGASPPEMPPASASSLARSLRGVRLQAQHCRACDLWRHATQTVFGEGPSRAAVLFLGEQPRDQEDRSGRPFVGPAGRLLDRVFLEIGIDRESVYLTNVVKHFKYELRGKRRLHQRADRGEQQACRIWLEAELSRVRPQLIVCLGATAANAIFGADFALMKERGKIKTLSSGQDALATVHPSYLLRLYKKDREVAYRAFVKDLRAVLPYLSR